MKFLKIFIYSLISIFCVACLYLAYALNINPKSPKGNAEYISDGKVIEVRYYRPFKNGRLILSLIHI